MYEAAGTYSKGLGRPRSKEFVNDVAVRTALYLFIYLNRPVCKYRSACVGVCMLKCICLYVCIHANVCNIRTAVCAHDWNCFGFVEIAAATWKPSDLLLAVDALDLPPARHPCLPVAYFESGFTYFSCYQYSGTALHRSCSTSSAQHKT